MTAEKILLGYTISFSLNDYEKNDKIICKFFKDKNATRRKHKSWASPWFCFAVGRCVLILAVALLDGAGIACFSVGLKTCAITAAIKTYKSIINNKERSMLI